jgi:hypothetical protein
VGYNITDRPTRKIRIKIMVLRFFFMGYSLMLSGYFLLWGLV